MLIEGTSYSDNHLMLRELGHSGPINMREGFMPTYLAVLKGATLARLKGGWDGESLWNGWDIKRVEEIINENHWDV
jgi:hypothetical protein